MDRLVLAAVLLLTITPAAYSQEDAEGCKDHPLFNRLSNFDIESCQENFDAVKFLLDSTGKEESLEGNVFIIQYAFNEASGAKMPSRLQILRNYENAIVSKGGKKVYVGETPDGDYSGTLRMTSKDKDYWVAIRDFQNPAGTGIAAFRLLVLELEAMKQEIQASEMFEALEKGGSIALYINFETGKADIKPESLGIIDQVAEMLKENAALKISIEGHTDNVGTPQSNQRLSEGRAQAVQNAVSARGVARERLAARGWGQTKPVADNGSEEGMARNRRVEIVKQ